MWPGTSSSVDVIATVGPPLSGRDLSVLQPAQGEAGCVNSGYHLFPEWMNGPPAALLVLCDSGGGSGARG